MLPKYLIKYPRTFHFEWSPGISNDDKVLHDLSTFEGKRVIGTIKMDGENTNMYNDYIHARSLDSGNHLSRNWVKSFHAQISHDIPVGWRVCGENLYAKHSLYYQYLKSYFMAFSVWNDKNECLSWDETCEWCDLLGVQVVPVIYDGIWDESKIKSLYTEEYNGDPCEGYVIRLADSFHYNDFVRSCAKYVRKDHVQTDQHWMSLAVEKNKREGD